MAEKNSCSLAISLALASLTNNGDLAKRLADLSEQMTQQSLYEDGLKQGIDLGIEGDAKQLVHEYSLKQESTQIKFKSVLFGGLLANTAQGDDAIRQLMGAIKETGGTVAEALDLLDIMSRLDLTGLEDIAKIIGGTVEEATTITEGIRKKIAYYTGSNYSIVTSGSQVKAEKVQKQLAKQMKEAEDLIKEAERTLGDKTYKSVNKDLDKLKNGAKDNKRFWNTKEGRSVVNKMADKYGQPHNKEKLQSYLQKISDAQKTLQEQQNVLDTLGKELSDALNGDLKIIEDGQNPYLYVGADGEWKFNKTYNKDVSKRVLDYGQYVLARTLLTDTGTIPQSVYDVLVKTFKQSTKKGITNYLNEDLTEDWILDEDRTLDELLSRAYTNTQDLVSNGQLRNTYRQRLISLASDGDLALKDVEYIESLFNTMRFAGDGAGFADGFKYKALLDNAEELGVKVPKKDGRGLRDGIVDFFRDENFDTLLTQQTITLKNGTELTQRQLLELVSGMVNDINITKLIMSNDYTDAAILDVAGKYLIGDKKLGNNRLLALITSVKKIPATNDTRGIILKAITGKDIPEGTKVGFFDFRSMLEAADDVKARAEFRDKLADANKINLPSNTIENITERSLKGLIKKLETYKGGVILVNDSQWKMNSILSQAIYEVNRGITNEADKITVAFPKGGLMGKLSWENGKMVFKTSYSGSFNNFLRRVSIRTLGEANANTSITEELANLVRRGDSGAIAEMNKILEEDARKYFGAMLGEDPYSERLPAILEDMTGISFKNYDAVVNKADFWKRVDDRFMIGLKTVGKYDQEVTTVADVIKQVDNMSNAQIASDLSDKFGYQISEESITENGKIKEDIKRAYLNYQLSQTPIELLENKGRLLAVINGGVADNISIDQFKGMLLSNDYKAYKDIFFHNVDLSDEELAKHIKSINSMIMDGLSTQVADNLVAMGYSLPLVNVRDLVYDYLTDRLNVNNGFANAFLYKNNLPPTLSTLQGIVNEAMPSELRFGYDDAIKGIDVIQNGGVENFPDYITRYVEVENQFLSDTYSSLTAIAAIKDGARLPNVGHERQILKNILDEYYTAVKAATENGKTLKFSEAQKLKVKAGYALDMYEQDYLLSRYRQFLTPDERSELFGLKYGLGVTTNSQGLKDVAEYNNRIMDRYDNATKRIINQNDIIASSMSKTSKSVSEEIQKRQKELMEQGATMKVVDGQVIVVDTREELYNQLKNIPSSVNGLGVLKSLGRNGLNQLSNEQAYFLLNVVELARNADNKMNMITQTIYKLKPQLARLDFFRNFKAVDGLPNILRNNLLTGTDYLASFNNTATFDDLVKRNIFSEIKDAFLKNGHLGYKAGKKTVSPIEHLQEIIDNAISINVHELGNSIKGSDLKRFRQEAATLYQSAFTPYTILENVPKTVESSIDEILEIQQNGIREAMRLLGDDDRLSELIDAVSIQLDDGSVKTLRQVLDGDKNNINKTIFDTELDIIKTADENASQTINPSWSEAKRSAVEAENKKIIEATENNYMDGLRAYLNESEIVSQGERDLLKRARSSARELAKQYTLTNKLSDTDNALAGINEEIVRGFKSEVLGLKGILTRGGQSRLLSGTAAGNIQDQIMQRWANVKNRYRTLYSMTPEQLAAFEPKNAIDVIASNLAKYFKEIEGRLGSIDGVTGVTTSAEVNKAFAHIGEVVMNIDSIEGLYSIMSAIEGNQLLKFFRFSNVGDLSRVDNLVIGGLGKKGLLGYRNYVVKTDSGLNREWFNRTFASNFTDGEYNKMIQALCGFTIVSRESKWLQGVLNLVNASGYLTRVLMSYPGQLLTIGQQCIAYFLRQYGREENLGIEDLGAIDKIREQAGILKGAYNELNIGDSLKKIFSKASPDDVNPSSFYNRYGLPDVSELMSDQKFYTSDDLATMYSKIDKYGAQGKGGDFWSKFLRNTDAYKDNANNIIDGLFARNFKNVAFVKALQTNNYMTFATAEQFANFMASDVPETMKKKLMSTIMESSGRNFRNILGLGFSGLDRAVGGGAIRNIFIGLMQMFNFRGAWGQNIARQTSNWIMTGINMARKGLSKEGRDAIAEYIAKQPEFVNFSKQLFNDLQNMWHLTRFQDNGDWMPEDEHSMLDFIGYAYEVMQFSSQRWQGIQSYGTTRIGVETGESIIKSMANPEVYKDTCWVGALMNAMSKNLGRNWKVRNLGIKTLAQMTTNGGWDAGMEYLSNEFWKLSFGTLRYLMNEDETSYGYSTELIGGRPGAIPFIITGEASEDGDKAYSYDLANIETWLNITNWYDAVQRGDTGAARTYYMNNLDSFLNASQFGGFIKNSVKALRPYLGDTMQKALSDGTLLTGHVYAMSTPRELAKAGDGIRQTAAGQELFTNGYYVPADEADIKILVDEVLKQRSHRPGNDGFNKSMFNFDKSGHMASLEESNDADASMEMLLENIKYKRDDNFRFITNEKGQREVTDYWQMHMNDLNRRINDEDYLTTSNFNFINGWVEANNDDPNYMLYKRLIGEGLAGRYMNEKVSEYIDGYNEINGFKKDMELTKQELTDASGDYQLYAYLKSIQSDITGERRGFLESIVMLDKAASMNASIKMVARQMGELGLSEELEKIFKINEDGEVVLSSRYKAYIEEQAKLSKYLNEGDLESFVAETASITKVYQKDDPYGVVTTALISSRINRINQAGNLSPEQKAKAINVLMTDNYEFIQEHIPEFIDELGSAAKEYIDQMNNSLYDISLIGDDLTHLSEMSNSKSGRSNGISISNKAKNLLGKLGSLDENGDGIGGGGHKYDYNFIPVRFDGAKLLKATGSKGYSPRTASIAIDSYKPHSDFSISEDTKRKIKTTTTQTISSKKQLSDIEKKAQKALEAEI